MATADPNSYPIQTTVAVTAYPAVTAPTIDGGANIGGGCWSFSNPSATLSLYVSFNGVDDAIIIPPASTWTDPPVRPAKVWIKLSAAGSVVVTACLLNRNTIGGA